MTRQDFISKLQAGGVVRLFDRTSKLFYRFGRVAHALPQEGYVRQVSKDRRTWTTWNAYLTAEDAADLAAKVSPNLKS